MTKEINKSNTVLYYYWGNNQTLLVPFLKKMGYGKIVVRFHGFDLYKDRLGGYQPFRRPLLEALSIAAPISEFGLRYLKQEYSDIKFNARVLRLGVKGTGKSPRSQNGCVNIVSCSRIIRLKRIELIPRILKQLPFRIKWTHIGDGEFINLVYEEIKELPQNMKFELTGWMSADEVPEYYRNNAVDLFISLSESEGIPVSIMEALAAGIPVFSTDVGGIREIVNDEVGCLIDPNLTVEEMVELLAGFIKRYFETPELFRNRAHQRFEQMCDQEVCNRNLLQELLS
ncbi:MAG: glycosyltransferase [Cyclobacteriaceae bacterium]|nr:glycosyltransferase [Cyclobacteriaceae bacterium]